MMAGSGPLDLLVPPGLDIDARTPFPHDKDHVADWQEQLTHSEEPNLDQP